MTTYNHQDIEQKWQKFWDTNKTFKAKDNSAKEKFYCLDMFPYPSGAGLHVGHPLGYTATDIICRKRRHEGYEVLHPMGWDAFGLPAENYAIKTGTHPEVTTKENIKTFKRQIQSLGFSYDWDREVNTTDPKYFKWTQWIFLQLYKRGLAYEKEMPMAWCPQCKTVVANEEVEQGTHERCGTVVEKKTLKQWMLRITNYAERLLNDMDDLPEWPEKIKTMQRNWIGKSEGAEVIFKINNNPITIFTTRPDTLFGATYFVLSPEHPWVEEITTKEQQQDVKNYQKKCSSKSDLERTELAKDKTGVFTGAYAINPVNNEKIPVWIADYVLMSYGTGAIMAVPAHDERDFEFATKFELKIQPVVEGGKKDEAFCEEGVAMNSGFLDGMPTKEAKESMIKWLEEKKFGTGKVNYRLRDWVFTRQRYWGEPIPIVHCPNCGTVPIDEKDLPLELPKIEKHEPSGTGESPLVNVEEWVNVSCPKCGGPAKRETSTMPNWAGSSWYWLRYIDPSNEQKFCSKKLEEYWGPVDLYVGGAEHAVLHLLYARFWHKVLYDLGLVSTKEPFKKLINQGLVMGEDGNKMSKSLGNVVNPDEIVEKYGADTLRMYEMFMGPFEQSKAWNAGAVGGMYKFLDKIWRVFGSLKFDDSCPDTELRKVLAKTIKKVGEDIDAFKFNTAISQLMILFNNFPKTETLSKGAAEKICKLISPFAPHMAEELWHEVLGNKESIACEAWPEYDPKFIVDDMVMYAVQVNGKVRGDFEMAKDAGKEEVIAEAKKIEKVMKYLNEGDIKKEIFVPGKIVGFVVK